MDKITELQKLIDSSKRIVFFGGAGVSTESGIPDFRSPDGLYNQHYKYPPEYMLSHSCYRDMPEEFFRFYRDKILGCLDCKPNAAHYKLAELEKAGKLVSVVTQNIDGLHQAAGSAVVREVHGSVMRNYCERCGKAYTAEYIRNGEGVPRCTCGGRIKPDVVLYEEPLDCDVVDAAIKDIASADMLIIGGTSLAVYPASGFVNYYRGDKLVIINKGSTALDGAAALAISDSIGKVLKALKV